MNALHFTQKKIRNNLGVQTNTRHAEIAVRTMLNIYNKSYIRSGARGQSNTGSNGNDVVSGLIKRVRFGNGLASGIRNTAVRESREEMKVHESPKYRARGDEVHKSPCQKTRTKLSRSSADRPPITYRLIEQNLALSAMLGDAAAPKLTTIDDAAAVELALELATNTTATELDLCGHAVCDPGAIALATALETNTALLNLDLAFNRITPAGAEVLLRWAAKQQGATNITYSWARL